MSKMMLQLTLLVSITTGLATLAAISGCSESVTTPALHIETVHKIFPAATEIAEIPTSGNVETSGRSDHHRISEIRDSSGRLGYCVDSELVSRSGLFKIRVFFDPQLVIEHATVISYPWERGRDVRRRAFTSQFEGKGPEDPIEIGKDIDAITGATISCQVMAEGVRDAIKSLTLIKTN